MNKLEALRTIRELIAHEEDWLTGPEATDKNGLIVDPTDKTAVKFCLVGAIVRVVGGSVDSYSDCDQDYEGYNQVVDQLCYNQVIDQLRPVVVSGFPECFSWIRSLGEDPSVASEDWFVATFNDYPDTKHANVIGVLDKAIRNAEVQDDFHPACGGIPQAGCQNNTGGDGNEIYSKMGYS